VSSSAPARRRLATLRLAAQRIGGRSDTSAPADVVRWMLALQGQDLPGVKWSVGVRQEQGTQTAVDAAFEAGTIVRSWPLRGTLHLVAAEDLGWLLELTAVRALRSAAARRAVLELAESDVEGARETVVASLRGGRFLTRDALLAAIAHGGVSTAGQRGYHILWYLAQTGTLVLGAPAGRQQTFHLLDEWVREPRRLEGDAALSELALRFFCSHGPATAQDLARWSGLPLSEVRRGLDICGPELTTLELEGTTYHLAPETLEAPLPSRRVHLLPGFDEYLLGYGDRSAALRPEHAEAIVPGGNGMFLATIVLDGQVVGTWKRTVKRVDVVIEPRLFGPLPRLAREGLVAATAAYGAYLGLPARLA
jgi:DNA glycosylase AlkZ-like